MKIHKLYKVINYDDQETLRFRKYDKGKNNDDSVLVKKDILLCLFYLKKEKRFVFLSKEGIMIKVMNYWCKENLVEVE